MKYITRKTLEDALTNLRGTADHLLKIWLVLKAMGLDSSHQIIIDTSNSTPFLQQLFSYGDPENDFFIPFAATDRFLTMKHDASRSVIQTTIKRWTEGSVVTVDPTRYLQISNNEGKLVVSTTRQYPEGLGHGKSGFALEENTRINIPDLSFAIWILKDHPIPEQDSESFLRNKLMEILNLSKVEYDLIFTKDDIDLQLQNHSLSETEIFEICTSSIQSNSSKKITYENENITDYKRRIKRKMTITDEPSWLNYDATKLFEEVIQSGEKAILIYGPPRTGKTRMIDKIADRKLEERVSIQLHEGWSYENLIIGLQPVISSENFEWKYGPLGQAIQERKKYIVLEEINRTRVSQALGEVFSLIEKKYRGEENKITLPNGDGFFIDEETIFILTMNTIDESTEDIDDALLGRLTCIEFKPKVEYLNTMLTDQGIQEDILNKISDLYIFILQYYPLGHGYFAYYDTSIDFKTFYMTRIRPTLQNHFQASRIELLNQIDTKVDSLFV